MGYPLRKPQRDMQLLKMIDNFFFVTQSWFSKMGVCPLKMGVCLFYENGPLFYENGS